MKVGGLLSSPLWGLLDSRLLAGDCVELMASVPSETFDAIVTDPPYGLEFMGKEWDRLAPFDRARAEGTRRDHGTARIGGFERSGVRYVTDGAVMQRWHETWAEEALRVLKPGGHLLAFGGTRTYHRLVCAIEDVGFEIRDTVMWLYAQGFPKSLDVGKAIDKDAGVDREVVGKGKAGAAFHYGDPGEGGFGRISDKRGKSLASSEWDVTAPATAEAVRWDGWGTALKPAHEPIVVARKPLQGTVAKNVLTHGTGALNIDACRIPVDDCSYARNHSGDRGHAGTRPSADNATNLRPGGGSASDFGRHPANLALDPAAGEMLDAQSGVRPGGGYPEERGPNAVFNESSGGRDGPRNLGDSGGASRFFFCSKVMRVERDLGLKGFETKALHWSSGDQSPGTFQSEGTEKSARNHHPTVKPIDLMRWLCRLVTPPGGLVLDPFAGSGSTGCAAVMEGFEFVGMEREAEYIEIAEARIAHWSRYVGAETEVALRSAAAEDLVKQAGQLGLLEREESHAT